jgi:putative pyruvate formate lyase activating enzyme
MRITRAALHYWEEPIISGTRGSGTIFFSGCSLGCVYCQNASISRSSVGRSVTPHELSLEMLRLEREGAHNINFVTPTHFAPGISESVRIAKENGLSVPIVYNTGSYDTVDTLAMLEGLVDVYLPDLKYYRPETAARLSYASDYPSVARLAIAEMVRQRPHPVIEGGIMRSGVIVRILLLPSHVAEAKLSVRYLYETYGDNVYISLMNQYTPMRGMTSPLDRTVTNAEYSELVSYAERIGVVNAFVQEGGTQSESFIPEFTV